MICTFYSHYTGTDRIIELLKRRYPKAELRLSHEREFQLISADIKGGLFRSSSSLRISYRQREKPSFRLLEEDTCPLSTNLKGLYGMVSAFPSQSEELQALILQKITTANSEFSFMQEKGQTHDLKNLLQDIAQAYDAFLFVQPGTVISRSEGQHFLDKNLLLLLDANGDHEVDTLHIEVESKYYAEAQPVVLEDQRLRRKQSEQLCAQQGIPVYQNPDALFTESETRTKLRTKDEVVNRAIALCFVEIKSEGADAAMLSELDKRYTVGSKLSPLERAFVEDDQPDEQAIANANWRAESFHVLLWALGFIDELVFPAALCIVGEDVKHLFSKSEDAFRAAATLRSVKEILDQADLALRYNWACVNARIKNQPAPGGLHPGVVYERHYALNWLIRFNEEEWDEVSTPT